MEKKWEREKVRERERKKKKDYVWMLYVCDELVRLGGFGLSTKKISN